MLTRTQPEAKDSAMAKNKDKKIGLGVYSRLLQDVPV